MALDLWHQMPSNGVSRNVLTYQAVLRACCRAGQWQETLQILEDMKQENNNNVHPNWKCYQTALVACQIGGQWQRALSVLQDMKKSVNARPNLASYNLVIDTCAKAQQWEPALQLLQEEMSAYNVTHLIWPPIKASWRFVNAQVNGNVSCKSFIKCSSNKQM